jgi:hypothetical protein
MICNSYNDLSTLNNKRPFDLRFSLLRNSFVLVLMCLNLNLSAQQSDIYRSPVRKILNMFALNVSTGYAKSNYNHDLTGFYFIQTPTQQMILSNTSFGPTVPDKVTGYTDWFNNPMLSEETTLSDPYELPKIGIDRPVNNPLLVDQNLIINTDTAALAFKGLSHVIPVMVSVHFQFKMIRVGVGYQFMQQFVQPLKPTLYENQIRPYEPAFNSVFQRRLFGIIGVKFYEWWNYGFAAEVQFGTNKSGSKFNPAFVTRNTSLNLGLSIEKSISEYVRITFRPSYDINNFSVTIPEGQGVVQHKNPQMMFQIGLSINYPRLPRSPMKADHVQLEHIYTDPKTGERKEVRGQPIWRWQNPKIGQNHRQTWRNKRGNRRKMNPY